MTKENWNDTKIAVKIKLLLKKISTDCYDVVVEW